MAVTTKTVYKIDTIGLNGKQTITIPDPVDITTASLSGAAATFKDVGLTIQDGYKVVTNTYSKQYPEA